MNISIDYIFQNELRSSMNIRVSFEVDSNLLHSRLESLTFRGLSLDYRHGKIYVALCEMELKQSPKALTRGKRFTLSSATTGFRTEVHR